MSKQSISTTPVSSSELIELRALQRTFSGAYLRTALAQFSFSLIILKIFTREFYSIGGLFAVFGACIYCVSLYRAREGNRQFFVEIIGKEGREENVVHSSDQMTMTRKFRTSGNVVFLVTGMSVAAYVALLVLVIRLPG